MNNKTALESNRFQFICFSLMLIILSVSLVLTEDRFTWILEVFPILIGLPLLVLTHKKYQFTYLVYALIVIHSLILSIGGIYTYAKVPLGFWMQDWFGFARNHFDRIGHFAQGFIPALIARELLIRTSPLKPGKWLFFIVICICLAISAIYELIEFVTSVSAGQSAEAFLGSQGDIWDAQWDMTFAFIGVLTALIFLSKFQDRIINKLLNKSL